MTSSWKKAASYQYGNWLFLSFNSATFLVAASPTTHTHTHYHSVLIKASTADQVVWHRVRSRACEVSGVTAAALSFLLSSNFCFYENHLSCLERTETNSPERGGLITHNISPTHTGLGRNPPLTEFHLSFSDQWTMWEGGRTLNRLTQAPPLRSARIQRLSSRSWHPPPFSPLLLSAYTILPIPPLPPHPPPWSPITCSNNLHSTTPRYPASPPPPLPLHVSPFPPTIATVSCKTCRHAIGWMCTEKWPTKTPLPESMWRQRYPNTFIDDFSPNLETKKKKWRTK